jgi:hypothetical protein
VPLDQSHETTVHPVKRACSRNRRVVHTVGRGVAEVRALGPVASSLSSASYICDRTFTVPSVIGLRPISATNPRLYPQTLTRSTRTGRNARQHGVFRDLSLWSATLQSAHVPGTWAGPNWTTFDHSTSRQERSRVRRVVQGLRRHPARLTARSSTMRVLGTRA